MFCLLLLALWAQAEIVMTGENVASAKSQVTAATYTPNIVSNDLIEVGQPEFSSWTKDKTPYFESTTLNDGKGNPPSGAAVGTYMPATFGGVGKLPFTYTYTLNTTIHTQGYNIAEIRTYAGWTDNGSALGNQKYELLVSTVDTNDFISLGVFTYAPFNNSDPNAASATKVTLTNSVGGVITSRVDQVRFVFMNHGFSNVAPSIDGSVYYEVDVLGYPVKEPTPIRAVVNSYQYDGSGAGAIPNSWPDSGGIELINGVLPSAAHYTDAQWVGFADSAPDDGTSHPQVTFQLAETYDLTKLQIVYFHSTSQAGGSVTAPEQVFVSFSTNGVDYSTPLSFTSEFNHAAGDQIRTAIISLNSNKASSVRLDFRNTSQWTFLAEVMFDAAADQFPTLVLDEPFIGTTLDTTDWIEHDSSGQVSQNDGLFMATGTGSWMDCGLESVASFARTQDLVIETIAKVNAVNKFATPIGFGTWDLGTSSYFMTFQSNGRFWTWKEYTGTDTGIAYGPNRWYKFRMRLTPLFVRYSVYSDWNNDGDFDDPDEDRDLLATAPGNILYHTAYDNLKVRLSNYSCGLMTVKQVTVYERYTHTLLQQTIASAQTLHDQAVEGTVNGQYPVGSKATLQAAIDAAQAVDDDPAATRSELDAATTALTLAANTFRRSVVGGLPMLHHILGTGQSLSEGWNGTPPLTTTQPFNNLMLSGVGQTGTDLVPLIEGPNLHSALVETISSALGNTLAALSPQTNYTSIVTRNGEGSQAYVNLKKGTTWYAKGIGQIQKAQAASTNMGHTYQVAAVTTVHGESDHVANNGPYYAGYLKEWQSDYQADAQALTGQTNGVPLFFCQMSSHTKYNSTTSLIPGAQLSASETSRALTLVCPKYFLTYSDGVHLTAQSYRHLGEYYGKALKRVLVDHAPWDPLKPVKITRSGATITVDFAVPVPPLAIDTTLVLAQTNYGFEYADDTSSATISSVSITDADTMTITLSATPTGANPRLRYAYTGVSGSWAGCNQAGAARGNIRDSDATPSLYGSNLNNWLVHFDHPIPFTSPRHRGTYISFF
jgi:hypothetical protein